MTQQNIPPATLAAGDRADPDWWLACAEWHEAQQSAYCYGTERYHSAAALACRTFAEMMRRAEECRAEYGVSVWQFWIGDGIEENETYAMAINKAHDGPLPSAAVDMLTDGWPN